MNAVKGYAVYFDSYVPYERAVCIQERLARARSEEEIPDTVLFLQHPPVVTLGRRGATENLLVSPENLEEKGIALYRSSRGGDITYHAPGQLVMYPIIKLGRAGADAHGHLYNLEETAIRTCADYGVEARRVPRKNGAWTDSGKIAAIGFHIKRWVTIHGMSFNVDPDLEGFEFIIPCGLHGDPVCSLGSIKGKDTPSIESVRESMKRRFEEVFERRLDARTTDQLPDTLRRIWPE